MTTQRAYCLGVQALAEQILHEHGATTRVRRNPFAKRCACCQQIWPCPSYAAAEGIREQAHAAIDGLDDAEREWVVPNYTDRRLIHDPQPLLAEEPHPKGAS